MAGVFVVAPGSGDALGWVLVAALAVIGPLLLGLGWRAYDRRHDAPADANWSQVEPRAARRVDVVRSGLIYIAVAVVCMTLAGVLGIGLLPTLLAIVLIGYAVDRTGRLRGWWWRS